MKKYSLAFVCFALANMAMAETSLENTHQIKTRSESTITTLSPELQKKLSEDITWQRLLLYKNGESVILDKSFFISAQGKTNAYAELVTNLNALQNKQTAQDYLCRFPARSHWLMSQIPTLRSDVENLIGTSHCQQVDDWLNMVDAKRLSLVHAEEHVNRVGSGTGHTLIKIGTAKSLQSHDTDDAYFLNFATDESIPQSALKSGLDALHARGIGAMTFGQYTPKQADYLINDERDIWQYDLTLNQDEIDQIMRHLWEVKDTKRYYNFLSNNCATEVLRFMDLVLPEKNLLKQTGKITAPAEVARVLAKNQLLGDEKFIPSYRTVKQADKNDDNSEKLDENVYAKQAQTDQIRTFKPSDNSPLNASRTHRASVGFSHSDDENIATIGVRGAYQDLLDSPTGRRDFLNFTLMSFNLGYHHDKQNQDNDKIRIENWTLFEALKLNPKNGTAPHASSGLHLKILPVTDASNRDNDSHHVVSTSMEYGASWFVGHGEKGTGEMPKTLCYALGEATGQVGKVYKGYRIGVGVHTGCIHYINDKMRLLADAHLPYYYHGDDEKFANGERWRGHYFQPNVSLTGQYDLGKNQAIRAGVGYEKNFQDHKTTYSVAYQWFFD